MPETVSLYEQIKSGQWYSANPTSENRTGPVAVAVTGTSDTRLLEGRQPVESTQNHIAAPVYPMTHLGTMPDSPHFVGREDALLVLNQRIGQERCPLFALFGLPSRGKSALASTFVQRVREDETAQHFGFQRIVWQSLEHSPSCEETIQNLLAQLESGQPASPVHNIDRLITRLFNLLSEQRCLLVLDGVDKAIGTSPFQDREYDRLFRLLSLLQKPSFSSGASLFPGVIHRSKTRFLALW